MPALLRVFSCITIAPAFERGLPCKACLPKQVYQTQPSMEWVDLTVILKYPGWYKNKKKLPQTRHPVNNPALAFKVIF